MWLPIDGLLDEALAKHASRRGRVRLVNGRVATLVAWPLRRGRYCRLQTRIGSRFSVHISKVEAIEIPEVNDDR